MAELAAIKYHVDSEFGKSFSDLSRENPMQAETLATSPRKILLKIVKVTICCQYANGPPSFWLAREPKIKVTGTMIAVVMKRNKLLAINKRLLVLSISQ